MLFRSWDQLLKDPQYFLTVLVAIAVSLLIAITVHEFSHALIAYRLGDSTARRLGRLSLNPLVHLDPLGTIMLFFVGFGWGKPVPVNPLFLRGTGYRGMALVSMSGPLSNAVTAAIFALPLKLGLLNWHSPFSVLVFRGDIASAAGDLLGFIVFYNLLLGVFNLIPLAPLDGFKVVLGILPKDMAQSFAKIEPYGPFILLSIIVLDWFVGLGILSTVIGPPINFLWGLLLGNAF